MSSHPCPTTEAGLSAIPRSSRRRPRFEVVDLGVVAGNHNVVHAINNAGHVVGAALDGKREIQAFVSDGVKRTLGTLGGVFSVAHGINNTGQIVGGSLTSGNESFHAFLFTGQAMYDLNELVDAGGAWELVQAVGINDRGEIVGIGMMGGQDHVFLLRPQQKARGRKRSPRLPRVV